MSTDSIPAGPTKPIIDEPPPVLGTWPRVYVFVLCDLALMVLLFYLFTRSFAP